MTPGPGIATDYLWKEVWQRDSVLQILGRCEGVDLPALKLTAYTIKGLGESALPLAVGEPVRIYATDEAGSGQVQDKTRIALAELIEKVYDLFVGDLTPGDKLVYVNDVIEG